MDKDELFIVCKCVHRDNLISIEFEELFQEFSFNGYRKYPFRKKKAIYEVIFSKDQAQEIIDFLQEKLGKEKEFLYEYKSDVVGLAQIITDVRNDVHKKYQILIEELIEASHKWKGIVSDVYYKSKLEVLKLILSFIKMNL